MNKKQKKALYESIMKQVAKTVKNALNEVRVSDNLLTEDEEYLEFDEEFFTKTELEDGTIIISDLTENIHDIVVKMYEADTDSFGHYSMELLDENEIDCYDWDEYEQKLIDKAEEEGGDVYTIKNDIGDFVQPIGVAIII